MSVAHPLPAASPVSGRRRRAHSGAALLAAGALVLSGCGLLSPDDAGAGTTTPAPSSASSSPEGSASPRAEPGDAGADGTTPAPSSSPSPASPAAASPTVPGYPGHERVERALREEMGADAQISSHAGADTGRLMASRGVDVFGALNAGLSEPCRSKRAEVHRRTVDGMVGATFAQTADSATGELHMMNVVVMRDEATWKAVDGDHRRVREECLGEDARERTTVPVEAGEATVTQSVLHGYPTAASDQVMRSAYVPGGRVTVNEMAREPLGGRTPAPLEDVAAERVPQLERLLSEAAG